MPTVQTNHVTGYLNSDIAYTLIQPESSTTNRLAILLPGMGYTTEAPLFRYTIGLLLEAGYGVVEVHYRYQDKKYAGSDIEEAVRVDVGRVIDSIRSTHKHTSYLFVAKSLGTIALADQVKRDIFKQAKSIWLTPLVHLDDVYETLLTSHHDALVLMGTDDRFYVADRLNEIQSNPKIETILKPSLNHSLEYADDSLQSILVMHELMKAVKRFIYTT